MDWNINFISHEDFKNHVAQTIESYGVKLKAYDLKKFNSNIIDPIKLVFDKHIYNESWEELIASELLRQRDKAGNNDIGYFHQRIFKYIDCCHVPDNGEEGGWDIIYRPRTPYQVDSSTTASTVYVEMKNKHNTMNSASQSDTYIKMQNQLLNDDNCCCFLVEAIAKESQNIVWKTRIADRGDKRTVQHKSIRRVSLDQFYAIVTGESDAFYQICIALPEVVKEVLQENGNIAAEHDTVFEELKAKSREIKAQNPLFTDDLSFIMALYMLGFSSYNGFSDLNK